MDYIASILKDRPHLVALVESAEAVMEDINLAPLLMYLLDSADPQAFPFLADQFGVLGFGGFILAETEEQQRALLKKGLELQRHKGTPWAVKESLKTLGYGETVIIEPSATPYALKYDGAVKYDGTVKYGGAALYNWATFDIVLDIGEMRGISATATATAVKIVETYKPARSQLVNVSYKATLSDALPISDDPLSYSIGETLAPDTVGNSDIIDLQVKNAQGNTILTDTF